MALADIQTAFTGGEISPQLYGRVDIAKFQIGAALLRNFFIDYRGGAANRPGTEFIASTKNPATATRLIPFIVSETASYVIELGAGYLRFYSNGVQLQSSLGVPYEISVPYAAADLFTIKYTQSADVLTLVHPSYPPANLTRTSDTTFTYAVITTGPTIQPPTITAMRAPHNQDYMYGYLITSVDLDGKEESLPSNIGVYISLFLDPGTNQVIGMEWTAPSQPVSHYNIYKWGPVDHNTMVANTVWGFIGSAATTTFTDTGIAPDFSKQPPEWGDPFSGGQFESITVTGGGSGYSCTGNFPSIPYVPLSITGDGTDAAGWAVFDQASGTVKGAFLTNVGKNYTTATITANGSGGTGATFTYTLSDIAPLNPGSTAYVQQRRVFAGSNLKPETLVMSQTGLYNNFNTTPTVLDTDAITASMASQEVNTIKSMVPVAYGLLVFTIGGCFLVSGGTPGAAITPSTISIQPQVSPGANDLRPIVVNYDVLFGQAKGNRIRNLSFAWQRQSYTGSDITYLAPHLFDTYHTVDWAWAEEPYKLLWLVRDDGTLLTCTYVPEQEVFAWARHDTQGLVKSVCSVPEGDQNAVYVIVERHIPGANPCWVQYIERFANRQGCCIFDAWFLDCALSLPSTEINSPIFLSGSTGTVTITSYDPCLPAPGSGPFTTSSSATGFVMQAKENYDPTRATEADGAGFPTTTFVDTHLLGYSYDPTHRELVYSAIINRQSGTTTLTNTTGVTLWDGLTAVANGATTFPATSGTAVDTNWNYYMARKNIDTGVVTFYDAYNPANLVPAGIGGGDGTWQRYVSDTAQGDQYPILTDPRTGDAWVHQESCELYYFARSASYSLAISPLRPAADVLNPVLPVGMNTNWVYATEFTHTLPATTANLYLIPRTITAAETTADVILAYGTFTFPQLNPYCECVVDNNGDLYVMMWNGNGAPSSFTLYKFTQPTSIPYPSPPVGGGFTDITPWTASTGPNADTSGTVANYDGGRVRMFWNEGRTVLNILTVSTSLSSFGHIDHTWYNVGTGAWATTTLADSWMTAAFVPTNDLSQTAYNITGRMNPTNSYLDKDNFYASGEYAYRWIYFEACPVDGTGAPITTSLRHILVKLTWNDNAAPTIAQVLDEENTWDPNYTTYATAIGHPEVIRQSIEESTLTYVSPGFDGGVYDSTNNEFWWSGMSSASGIGDNMFQLDAAFTGRIANNAQPPILRLAFTAGTTGAVNVGDVIQIGCGKIAVSAVNSEVQLTGTVTNTLDVTLTDDPTQTVPIASGDWTVTTPAQTVSGLTHLEGKTVYALADGLVEGPFTVSSGSVTLSAPASSVVVGLKYTQQIKTLYLTTEGIQPGGTDQGKRKLITGTTIRLDCSRGIKVGDSFDTLVDMKDTIMAATTDLFTGDAREPIFPNWDTKGEICVEQDNPLPAQVLGVIVEVTPGDTGR